MGMPKRFFEKLVEKVVFASGVLAILAVILIFIFLFKESFVFFSKENFLNILAGRFWYPISEPPQFGFWPLIVGSLFVTLGAVAIAVPIGLAAAIYIAEVASKRVKDDLKTVIELLAAIPSIVLGFIGIVVLAPFIKSIFGLPSGLTALTGSLLLGFMAVPTIVSIIEDAITSVPKSYKEGALALGATHWQTIRRVILPAAFPGIMAAIMLGIGRVIGETMAVLMVTGNAAVIPGSLLQPVRTLTATVAAEMGEVVRGSMHYYALFGIGLVLFIITFLINLAADLVLHRKRY
jgi:phosphate transport system permease protein